MLLIPLLVGALAFLVGRGTAVARQASTGSASRPVLIAGEATSAPGQSAPSPLLVLDGFLRRGEQPPPLVIMCAIAEAEVRGQMDVAMELVNAFIVPVVEAADRQAAMSARDANGRGASPPGGAQGGPGPHHHHRHHHGHHGHHGGHGGHQGPQQDPRQGPQQGPQQAQAPGAIPVPTPWDPARTGPGPRPIARADDATVDFIVPVTLAQHHPRHPPGVPASTPPMPMPTQVSTTAEPPRAPAPGAVRPQTITVSGRSSPIEGISAGAWSEFAGRVAREQPTFRSDHHVGRFRQRRSRLAELGIDPESISGSPVDQDRAFDVDMRDAYRHALESGLIAEYGGHQIEIPSSDTPAPIQVTLSGVLGVIQAAGLEGAVGWLDNPEDRRRFPGTTRAFLRTNGVF